MKEVEWVHFARHGVQDPRSPANSGLCLAKKRSLKVSDVIILSRSRGGHAFLSACQVTKGDKDLSDETVHIAEGVLFQVTLESLGRCDRSATECRFESDVLPRSLTSAF